MLSRLLLILRSAAICVLLLFAIACVAQTTVHVGPGQTYTTIQSGIDAANNGDTVLVAPGTYKENIDFKGKAITVTSSAGAATTILDGGSRGAAVTFKSGETNAAVISGFTIQHGGEFNQGNFQQIGSVYVESSAPTILGNTITLSNCWGIETTNSSPIIKANTISQTQDAQGQCSFGGGAAIKIETNFTSGIGPPIIIFGNTIENNTESGMEDAGGNGGAGVAIWGGNPVVIQNNIFRSNASPGGSGGAINIESSPGVVIAQNLIYGNTAGCGGGAIATSGFGSNGALVINNTMVDNFAGDNGGSSNCAKIAQIYPSPDRYGSDSPSDIFIDNIISGSTSYPAVNCSWYSTPTEANQPTFQNNILYNAGGPFFGSYCVDVSTKYNNIAADPQFVDAATHDYHLKSTSPAIDAGQNGVLQTYLKMTGMALSNDFDGKPRIQDATGKGCIIDMGAYEAPGTASQCGFETLTSSLNPALAGQSVTFTAQLTSPNGTPTGTVQFLDGASLLSTQTVSATGAASYTTNSLAVGSHTIIANYQPTGTFAAGSASVVQVINGDPTATALTCSPNPIDVFKTARLTAAVTSSSGTPTGSVSFTDNGSPLTTSALAGGAASVAYTPNVAATHTIVATYVPTGPYAASSATCSEVVNPLPTTSALTVSPVNSTYGSSVTLTATVSPATPPGPSAPTGVVTFYNGSSALGTATLTGGVASIAVNSLAAGSYSLGCTYSGSSVYGTSKCNTVVAVVNAAPTALSLTSSSNPATYLSPFSLIARLTMSGQSAGAGKMIRLGINGQNVTLTTDASGSATYNPGKLDAGSYPLTASFAGTSNLLASSASLTEVIAPAVTTTSLTVTPSPGDQNQGVTLVANVTSPAGSGPNGGTVTFYDGSTSLGSAVVTSTGAASFVEMFTVLGAHDLTAAYSGDTDFSASTSAVFQETIDAGDFTINATPGSAAMYTGQSATVRVNVASLRGFNQPLDLSCAGLPANASCEFTPATLDQGQGTVTLVIKTTAPQQTAAGSISALGALLLLLLPMGKRRRRGFFVYLCAVVLAVGSAIGLAGCSGNGSISGGTPPGSYSVAVTASTGGSSAPVVHSAVVTLTVKSLF